MAELLGTIGAIVGLVEATDSLLGSIQRLLRAIGGVPAVIKSVRSQIAYWQTHLDALYGLSRRCAPNAELGHFLKKNNVLADAESCLESLASIIAASAPAPPDQEKGRISVTWDRFTFHKKYGHEVEKILKRMSDNTEHIRLALAMSTELVPRPPPHSTRRLSLILP